MVGNEERFYLERMQRSDSSLERITQVLKFNIKICDEKQPSLNNNKRNLFFCQRFNFNFNI